MLDIYRTKRKIPAVEVKGGREVCTKTAAGLREYCRRTEAMWERQRGLCSICGLPMRIEEATFEHDDGRGHGGGHRDDRIEVDGEPKNSAAHGICNVRKGSVRLKNFKEAVNGK